VEFFLIAVVFSLDKVLNHYCPGMFFRAVTSWFYCGNELLCQQHPNKDPVLVGILNVLCVQTAGHFFIDLVLLPLSVNHLGQAGAARELSPLSQGCPWIGKG
jgi:hypothetical protein